jgi:energy-coupling factor transporter ATP-binding protein EcfA2
MNWESNSRLVGVTLIGPAPIGRLHILVDGGLTALYGRNGIGKTRILDALAATLRGERGEGFGFLHVEIKDPSDVDALGWGFEEELCQAALQHLGELRGQVVSSLARDRDLVYIAGSDEEYSDLADRLRRFTEQLASEEFGPYLLTEAVAGHIEARATLNEVNAGELEKTLARVAAGGSFVLHAVGTPGSPRWDAYAAMTSQHPDDRALLEEARSAGKRYRDWVDAVMALTDVNDRIASLSERPFVESSFPWDRFSDIAQMFVRGATALRSDVALLPVPDWVTSPVANIGSVQTAVVPLLVDATISRDVNEAARSQVAAVAESSTGRVMALYEEGEAALDPRVERYLAALVETANQIVSDILPDSPRLQFALGDPHEWLQGRLPEWTAEVGPGVSLPLGHLSDAQSRWASIACALAIHLTSASGTEMMFICDEPEAGLHRLAEQRLPHALAKLAAPGRMSVVVATHSPAMLNNARVTATHVARTPSGDVTTRSLAVDLREALHRELAAVDLGLTAADLLQLIRAFVIVEGPHDEAALTGLLGSSLDPSVVIYPVGGAKQIASLVTAGILWDFTEADVVIVLDGLRAEELRPMWQSAQNHRQMGNPDAAIRVLAPLTHMEGGEARWLHTLLAKAIQSGQPERLFLETLSEPDIICYLPPEAFVPGKSWEEMKHAWKAAAKGTATDLKGFLRRRYGARISTKRIQRAAQGAPASAEIQRLGLRIQEVAAFNHQRASHHPPEPTDVSAPSP